MIKKNDSDSSKKIIIQFLKKNKDIFVKYPELIDYLNFPPQIKKVDKVVDLNAYRSIKIKKDYDQLKQQMSEILQAGMSHLVSQKRILKTSLKILNTKNLTKLIDVIVGDLGTLLDCDYINCFFTSNKIQHKNVNQIDNKLATNFFKDKPQTYLNQSPKGLPIFFPNKSKLIKSYILLKIIYDSDRFYLAMGSKNPSKFTKDQKVDLIEYLIQIIQIKLINLK